MTGCAKGYLFRSGAKFAESLQPAIATVKALFISLDIEYTGELVFSGIDKAGDISLEPGALDRAYLAGQKLIEC